jgi:tRNA(adenine34) deaminase
MSDVDERFMKRCLDLARASKQAGESAVGSLLVRDGVIVAEAEEATRRNLDPSAHSELEAIRLACKELGTTDLSDCTMYTTVEPCFLCGYVIRTVGIPRVVMATDCGEIGSVGSRYAFLTDPGFEGWPKPPVVERGLMETEARELRGG